MGLKSIKKRIEAILLVSVMMGISACGYSLLHGRQNGERPVVYVAPVENRTAYAGMASEGTMRLRERLRSAGFHLTDAKESTPYEIGIIIFSVTRDADLLTVQQGREQAVSASWQLHATVKLKGLDGQRVEQVSVEETIPVAHQTSTDMQLETAVRQRLLNNLVERVALAAEQL